MGGKITVKICESCGRKYKFRYWDGILRKYRCIYCGNPTGKQEKRQ